MMNRRTLIKAMATAGVTPLASSLIGCANSDEQANSANGKPRVVVIGGGFGGATAAKYLKRFDSSIDVTLVEKKETYMTCPGSNWYLAGLVEAEMITHNYETLKNKHGVRVVHDTVLSIEATRKEVTLAGGEVLKYDRLIVSPGIDFIYDEIEGYSKEVAERLPHAYQAGPQTELLYQQLRDMKQGGTFVMSAPANPFRCPPGPYERLSMVADFFKKNNPTAKIICLDQKNSFSKQALFQNGWRTLYGGMIDWISAMDGGVVTKLDADKMMVYSDYENIKADVINVIPNQKAGKLAFDAGLTNESGWCPVNQETFESKIHAGVYVIGDAAIAGSMPKSGHSASSHAKMCAAAIVSNLHNTAMPRPKNTNTCYSLVGSDYGISVAMVYEMKDGVISGVEGAGGVSPGNADMNFRKMEANYARGWYASITADVWNS